MTVRIAQLLCALFTAAGMALPARAADSPELARTQFLERHYRRAVRDFAFLAGKDAGAAAIADYSLALAAAGLAEASLAQLDRAVALDPADRHVRFAASAVFAGLGLEDVSRDLREPAPEWLGKGAPGIGKLQPEHAPEPPAVEVIAADFLMHQGRYASAAGRLGRFANANPGMAFPRLGYAVALEHLGALRAEADAVRQHVRLGGDRIDELTRKRLSEFSSSLEAAAASTPAAPAPLVMEAPAQRTAGYERALAGFRSQPRLPRHTAARLSDRNVLILNTTGDFVSADGENRREWLAAAFEAWEKALQDAGIREESPWIETLWESGGAVWTRERGEISRVTTWSNGTPPRSK